MAQKLSEIRTMGLKAFFLPDSKKTLKLPVVKNITDHFLGSDRFLTKMLEELRTLTRQDFPSHLLLSKFGSLQYFMDYVCSDYSVLFYLKIVRIFTNID